MLLLLVVTVIILVTLYLKIKYFNFNDELPSVPPQFLFGNLLESGLLFGGKTLAEVFLDYKARLGDIFQFYIASSRLVIVNNANDIQHIFSHRNIYDQSDVNVQLFGSFAPSGMVCNKGAKYKRHSAIIAPLFRRGRVATNLNFYLIIQNTDKLLNKWRADSKDKIHVDIVEQCRKLLLDIFGFIAFDYDLQTMNDNNITKKNELSQALESVLFAIRTVAYVPPMLMRTYLKWSPRYQKAYKIIEQYVCQMIEQEQKQSSEMISKRERTPLIASLVASLQCDEQIEAEKSEEEKKGLSRNELIDEMLFFFVAGSETIATALSWFIHLMSKYPQIQHKIKEELLKTGSKENFSLENLNSLVYLECVIKEVLRFSPVIDVTSRTLTVDDRLPVCGAHLPRGTAVVIPIYNLARDNRYWSIDPNLFCPERFLNEDKNHHPYALIPFGGGHRQCVGQDLARFELKLIAARLMQHVTIGDGGRVLNAGGYLQHLTIGPRSIGVTITFD